jgi:hypothetical protein
LNEQTLGRGIEHLSGCAVDHEAQAAFQLSVQQSDEYVSQICSEHEILSQYGLS